MGIKDNILKHLNDHALGKARIFYFFYEAITRSLPRYLGLYYKHTLLLSPRQVAILLSARYFTLLFGSPFLGSIADKMNRYRNVLIITLLAFLTTYIMVPLVEPVDNFHCMDHVYNHSLSAKSFKHETVNTNVHVHTYLNELKTDSLGDNHYHGNLMYDLFYTWPFDTWEYLETDRITRKVFITLLIVTIIGEFFASPAETFADLYTLQSLGKDTKKFGLQIIPGLVGLLIISLTFSILTNTNVDLKDDFCHMGHVINYSPFLFVIYFMLFICIVVGFFFKYTRSYDSRQTEDRCCCRCNFLSTLLVLIKTPTYAAYAVAVVFSGMAVGIKDLYIYHYITEIGGPLYMLPIVIIVHFVSRMVALVLSPMLLEKYGHIYIISAGLLINGITFVAYSVIENPWLVFLVEPFEGVSQLSWVAIVTYAGSPAKIGASIQGVVHGFYRGLGIAIGFIVVSVLILKYGYLALFLALGIIYFLVFGFYLGVTHAFPKKETIAEEYGGYMIVQEQDEDHSGDEKVGYEYEKLDTSFLE